jgi:hypothetical protein
LSGFVGMMIATDVYFLQFHNCVVIFQKSVDCDTLPNDWLSANIAPVFKKGDVHAAENYRPVSLTCVSCKILEHVRISVFSNFSTPSTVIFRFCIIDPARCGSTVVEIFGFGFLKTDLNCLKLQPSLYSRLQGTLPNDWLSANTGPVFKKR